MRVVGKDCVKWKLTLLAIAGGSGTYAEAGERFTQVLQERFGIVDVGIDFGAANGGDGLDFVQLKFTGNFFDNFGLDRTLMIDECVDQGMFAEQVDDAGNAHRIKMNGVHSGRTKNRLGSSAGSFQTFHNVFVSLFLGHRRGAATQHNTLAELAKLRKL